MTTTNTNSVTLVGTAVNVRPGNTTGGRAVQNFGFYPKDPQYQGQILSAEAFNCSSQVRQGDLVRITGTLGTQEWTDSQGQPRTTQRLRTNGRGLFILARKGEGKKAA